MKYSIVFSSKSGNTKMLAEHIYNTLEGEECVYYGGPCDEALSAPLQFVGFWTDKGSCDKEMQDFLKKLDDKTVLLFGTAGFGGSQEYFNKILSNVAEAIPENNRVLPGFMCQGKMQMAVRKRYENMAQTEPENGNAKDLIENFDRALSHPNKHDMQELSDWLTGAQR